MDGFREITASEEDFRFLAGLYDGLYVTEFPDPDERESLANMRAYLKMKADGWYGASSYHILALIEGGAPVALSISDYLASANAGVIEFILTDPARRGGGIGRRMLEATSSRFWWCRSTGHRPGRCCGKAAMAGAWLGIAVDWVTGRSR